MSNSPLLITSLAGVPIAFITCGGNHSFAVSKSGSVFGWGKNLFGQLGVNDNVDRPYKICGNIETSIQNNLIQNFFDEASGQLKVEIFINSTYATVDVRNELEVELVFTAYTELDTYCTMTWDEVSLKAHLDYSVYRDEVDGFVDMLGVRRPDFGTHALTFMIRGINTPFKQPTGYFFTNGLKHFELAEMIKLMTKAVLDTDAICQDEERNNIVATTQQSTHLKFFVNL